MMRVNIFPDQLLLASVFVLCILLVGVRGQSPPSADHASVYLSSAGRSADDLVAYALANNGELTAIRREVEAAEALVKQAGYRANPEFEISGTKEPGMSGNSQMAKGMLPLELFSRRSLRIKAAQRELDVRNYALADRERILAADVRAKFGETLALIYKLQFADETLAAATQNYDLVAARVTEGKTAPLEGNMVMVELNRIRALRESAVGQVEIALLELRNLAGMRGDEPLQLRGDFSNLLDALPPQEIGTEQAVRLRPDLQTTHALIGLAEAKIEQARAQGKPDASVSLGVERSDSGFPFRAFDPASQLVPIRGTFKMITFGVTITLPVFDKNTGNIEAAVADRSAAESRAEFGELTVRREVAAAYARYKAASRAMEIYRVGVEKQSAENLDVVRQTYELGSRTLLDYIAEQRRYIEVKNGYIDAQRETYQARIDILRAMSAPELINK